jgi:drug/metabolite transporter (DMT)-like permease
VAAIPVFGLLTLLFEPREAWHPTASAIGSVLYLGVVAAGLGFVLIVWLVRSYSASRVNVFVFLSPVFGVLIGWVALGETVSAMQALGALAVAAGILVVTAER